ncbi:endosomal trafficking protein, RME-8, putative [Bodo saltans]|uniref:Endosomal trafficking protein, RME-8, putative n=1 Tax=Bodo saltans TaxID=75058 RepID=A0A0S4IQD7_BODSA|nr:endosomal trafficking protein, RME-8, putative [Bodo saltans]|eukprot:CUF24956.1 endosomal trafficking protein, RME-8, putative [Bodo saltans]
MSSIAAPATQAKPRHHKDAEDYTSRYVVVKSSWKGKYTRVLCISPTKCATINPNSVFKATNEWDYQNSFLDLLAVPKTPADILLIKRKSGKKEEQQFTCMSSAERAALLTDIQRYREKFDTQYKVNAGRHSFQARKYRSNEEFGNCQLVLTSTGISQRGIDGKEVGHYYYMHINALTVMGDNPNGLVISYGKQNKLHQYQIEAPKEFINLTKDYAARYVGVTHIRETDKVHQQHFDTHRLGVAREKLVSTGEFVVTKSTPKHPDVPVRRLLSTTAECIVERDPATYNCVSAYLLQDVYALVRCEEDAQKFYVEYKDPHVIKTYMSPTRDAVLAHIVDSCRHVGNTNVSVTMEVVNRGLRAAPLNALVEEEIESTLLRCLIEPQKGGGPTAMPFSEVVEFFNANVEYNGLRFTENRDGLFAENREKLIFGALMALLDNFPKSDDPHVIVQQFYALRRLCVTRIGFSSAAIVPTLVKGVGAVCVRALKMHHTAVAHAVIDFLNTLMTPHHDHYEPIHEQINKNRMLASDSFLKHLLTLLRGHIESDSGALVIQALLDFFVSSICPPYSDATDETIFGNVMTQVVDTIGKSLYQLLGHTCKAIRFSSGMIIRVIMEEGSEDQFFMMQRAALSEGGFLRMFSVSGFSNDREMRDLARKLVSYWTFDNQTSQDLLRRMVPITMLHFLQSKDQPPASELEKVRTLGVKIMSDEFREAKSGWFKKRFHPKDTLDSNAPQENVVITRARLISVKPTLNWTLFFYQLKNDHARPDLIWNHNTRNELRESLEGEIAAFQLGADMRREKAISWNYQEFEVTYPSLVDELKIGHHYPRLLFESQNPVISRPKEFFNDLYHRFLLVQDFNMKIQCLHGMSLLYKHYAEEIGQFNDIEYMVQMLEAAAHPLFRDRMLLFISQLLRARLNVKPFIDCNGVKPLMDLLTLAHLHIDRPQIHNVANALEFTGSPIDLQDQEKEWHFTNKQGEKCDPVSFSQLRKLYAEGTILPTTKVWAQGLGGWKDFKEVQQLRWGIMHKDLPGVLTLSEVTCNILDIFMLLCAYYPTRDPDGSVMQPLPKVKRYLSDPSVLPHIVQLLLTFDPTICSRVHSLLFMLMEDNPLMPRFFLSGAFFFSLMYMGSDVLPLCRLLSLAHRKQSFQIAHDNEIIRTSVLSPLLPPALVCFLHNHGPERFADIFLGEYETPEAIWGKDMRRYLVEKIAAHVSDFTPRLLGNCRAQYQYCPIVGVEYAQLENELFCSQYYLRHFCDFAKYPNWPVQDPIALMRDVLCAWKLELEKEPCTLSKESCLEELEMTETSPTTTQVRKAYFKLAAIYHPDKNPNGRERFEKIQAAYEFLASDKVVSNAPDPKRISLILKTQSILFSRFSDVMSKYKYAGYALLLKLIQMEYDDPEMLRKDVILMDPATELCFHTVNNVPLNTDELLHEGGLALLTTVMTRCFEMMTPSITDTEIQSRIAKHCMKTLHVSANFPDCRERIKDLPMVPHLAARGIAFEKAPGLSRASIHCAESLCLEESLQQAVTEAGAIWHLLLFVFRYDYTLEDSGVQTNEENHTQLFANRAAKGALRTIYALAGFRPGDSYIESKPNVTLYRLLSQLLTPFIVKKMRTLPESEDVILKLVNSNHETPTFLWNNQSRTELMDYIKNNSNKCRDAGPHSTDLPSLACEDFGYSAHQKELIVGTIFVRIYNLQPLFKLEEPHEFFQSLITRVQEHEGETNNLDLAMMLEAMVHVMTSYPSVHTIAEQYMVVLVRALQFKSKEVILAAFHALSKAASFPACVESLGKIPTVISDITLALAEGGDAVFGNALELIRQIMSDRVMVQQALERGFYVVLLHMFAVSRKQESREEACVCMAKACSDKLHGPKVFLRSCKLIPGVFIETMKENPTQSCQMFETWQENPELVWNAERRDRCVELLSKLRSNILEAVAADPAVYWKLPDDAAHERPEDIQVGGVYLSLFLKQPNWSVRKPKDFLIALLEKFVQCASDQNIEAETLDLVTSCTASFLAGQPSITDFMVALGYTQKLFKMMESKEAAVVISAARIVHEVANSRACVESMSHFDPVSSIMVAFEKLPDEITLIMDTLERLVTRSSEKANMIKLALSAKVPQRLLALLETGMSNCAQPAAARAIVVKVIKSMLGANDPIYGPQLVSILEANPVWLKFKDQSHDLFLTNTQFGGYLTGPSRQPVLSLAAPPASMNDSEPPPLD